MDKQLKTGALVLLSLIIFVGIGLYAFRNFVLETLIRDQLHKQGIPLQSISGLDVSFNALQLHGLMAGTNQELRVDKILATWNLLDLFAGKPVSIEMSGLQMALDLSEEDTENSLSDSMQSLTSATGKAINISRLPVFSLKDSSIYLHSLAGDLTVALSGDITQDQSGIQTIHFSAIASGLLGRAYGVLVATSDTQGKIQGKLTVSKGMLNLPQAKISSFAGEAAFAFAPQHPQHIQTEFVLSGINLPEARLAESMPDQVDSSLAAFKLDNLAIDQITLKGDVRGSPWSGKFDLAIDGGRLIAEPVNIQQVSVSLPIQINLDRNTAEAGLRSPARIMFGKIGSRYNLDLQGPLGISITQADFAWTENIFKHEIALTPANFVLLAKQEKSSALEMQIHPGKIALRGRLDADKNYQGQLTVSDAAFFLPQSHLQLKAVSANLYFGVTKTNEVADFTIGQLQHLAPEPYFKALSIAGSLKNQSVDGKPMMYSVNVAGGVPGLSFLKLSGEHAPDSGDGILKVQVVPLRFLPAGLQPSALSPIFDSFNDVSGLFSASAQVEWSKQGIRNSRGSVKLQNVSFAHDVAKVSDLNASLNLNNLLSPSSPPGQAITVRSIDPGVPLENLLVSYQIQRQIAELPRIAVEKMQFSMMDGKVSLEPTVIDPASVRSEIPMHIDNINLADFFDLIRVEGLTGSGYLDGTIPIALEGGQVLITNGHLAAKTPGIIRFKSEKASQLLADTGEEMNSLLQAMQNFHYRELSLNLDKSITHDLIAKLSLLGNNPDVKEGQTFRLNIKLETDLDKILDTINQGYNLSHEILRGSLKLQ